MAGRISMLLYGIFPVLASGLSCAGAPGPRFSGILIALPGMATFILGRGSRLRHRLSSRERNGYNILAGADGEADVTSEATAWKSTLLLLPWGAIDLLRGLRAERETGLQRGGLLLMPIAGRRPLTPIKEARITNPSISRCLASGQMKGMTWLERLASRWAAAVQERGALRLQGSAADVFCRRRET